MRAIEQTVYTWIASGRLNIPFDVPRSIRSSAVMILVVTGIGSLIHLYSTAYMHEETDSEYARYFSYLNLFAAFMLVLVLGASFPVMFVGWEGVGLCSYLLIGFWFTKPSAADAGKKAFIVNRIGDFGFILGMLADLRDVRHARLPGGRGRASRRCRPRRRFGVADGHHAAAVPRRDRQVRADSALRLAAGRDGRPDAGLRAHPRGDDGDGGRVHDRPQRRALQPRADHAATSSRSSACATALMAGTIGLVQNDIKRVLAYSTVSQLGYMFLAMGVGAFAAGIFHLYTHAFFKALLFLGSGAVIHALHGEQDLRNMGGLRKELPVTYWTFLIGTLAIAGVPLLVRVLLEGRDPLRRRSRTATRCSGRVGVVTAFLTATYMFRLVYPGVLRRAPTRRAVGTGTGHGARCARRARRTAHGAHLHDAPPAMAIALVVLAIGSVVAGYVGVPNALVRRQPHRGVPRSRASSAPDRGDGGRSRPARRRRAETRPRQSRVDRSWR